MFDREAIKKYLGNLMPLRDPEDLCVFHIRQRKGNWDHAEIQREILKQGKKYVKVRKTQEGGVELCSQKLLRSLR